MAPADEVLNEAAQAFFAPSVLPGAPSATGSIAASTCIDLLGIESCVELSIFPAGTRGLYPFSEADGSTGARDRTAPLMVEGWIEGSSAFFCSVFALAACAQAHATRTMSGMPAKQASARIEAAAEFGAHIGGVHRRVGRVLNRRAGGRFTSAPGQLSGWSKNEHERCCAANLPIVLTN